MAWPRSSRGGEGGGEGAWHPKVVQLSALLGQGVDGFWAAVSEFKSLQIANGQLAARRQHQAQDWMWERLDAGLKQAFRAHPQGQTLLKQLSADVAAGAVAASNAARSLLSTHAERAT